MHTRDHDPRIPITLLTGFLGSGKTTVLNYLLGLPEMAQAAVLINEFGSVAVDHHLVSRISEDLILLDSGCICCTVRGDLVRSLTDLFMRCLRREIEPVSRVVIETTGLADPAPVIFTLMEDFFLAQRFRTDAVVTVVDATHGLAQLAAHAEAVKQVVMADRLLVSKCDLADEAGRVQIHDLLMRLNPTATRIDASHGAVAMATVSGCGLYDPGCKSPDVAAWLAEEKVRDGRRSSGHEHHHDVERHDAHVYAFALRFDAPLAWPAFVNAIDMLLYTMGERILRIKGLLNIEGDPRPRVIQCVQHVRYPYACLDAWPKQAPYNDGRSRLVFIVRDLDRSLVEKAFALFCGVRDGYGQDGI